MSLFFTSTEYNESFQNMLFAMRGNWERGLPTVLFTPKYCSLLWVL